MATARLAFAGQLIRAAMIIRQQLERWTDNLAYNAGYYQHEGEDREAYINRVWSVDPAERWTIPPDGPQGRYPQFLMTRDAGKVFADLSEFIHGRLYQSAIAWDAVNLLDSSEVESLNVRAAYRLVSEAIVLVVSRLRACIYTYGLETGRANVASIVFQLPNGVPSGPFAPPPWSLFPLVPQTGLDESVAAAANFAHKIFEAVAAGHRPAGRLYRDDELLDLCFLDFRARAIFGAGRAFDKEREQLGTLDLEYLLARENRYIISSEIAGMASRWESGQIANALAIGASALRSAYWLWLEDDDRAMSMLRTVLEQIARVRTWRMKPEKATRLERSSSTMPRDWLQEAGLRRLSALNRALGEMTHIRHGGLWAGARSLIAELQLPETRREDYAQTGRGHALDWIALMLAREGVAIIGRHSSALAHSIGTIVSWFDADSLGNDRELQRFLNHAWEHRDTAIARVATAGTAGQRAALRKLFGAPSQPFRPIVVLGDPEEAQ